jgi:hypothetical protein
MKRAAVALLVALATSCGDTTAGKLCQPGDPTVCGDGFQCLTFCDADGGPQSICTPSFGAEAGDTFADEALIDGKVSFGELGNVRRFEKNLRIEVDGLKGVALPLVEEVVGDLAVVGTDIECLSLARLITVGGVLTIDRNDQLQKTELASLRNAGGLVVTDNALVSSLLLTSTTAIGGDVIVERNRSLAHVNLESLQTVDGAFTLRDDALSTVDLDVLDAVSGCVEVGYEQGKCATPPALAAVACCDDDLRRDGCAACP